MGYATLADLYRYGAPSSAFGTISDADRQAGLDQASAKIDEYIAARYPLPLISWPVSFNEYAARIAAWDLLSARGYNPAAGNEGDQNLSARADQARAMLTLIQKQQLHPAVVAQPDKAPQYAQPSVFSCSAVSVGTGATGSDRGW